jgi:hypothetical protein
MTDAHFADDVVTLAPSRRADRIAATHDASQQVTAALVAGLTPPSLRSISAARTWSATTRNRMSSGCEETAEGPD